MSVPSYHHIILSPHLDDAALSCGGLIADAVARSESVLVVTICAAAPDPLQPFNPLAQRLHHEWQLSPEQVVAARRREDAAALAVLGADVSYLDELDCIYRLPAVYDSESALFGQPVADDPLLPRLRAALARLAVTWPTARFYAPLAVGYHVDHQITYTAAADLPNLVLYEDFPYVIRPQARENRLHALGRDFLVTTLTIDATIERRVEAVACYDSQLTNLFGSRAAMPAALRQYAASVAVAPGAYGEVYRIPV